MGGGCCEREYEDRERESVRNRCDWGDGQRDDNGEIRALSQSTINRSSASTFRRAGREEGDEKEKSSNMEWRVRARGEGEVVERGGFRC